MVHRIKSCVGRFDYMNKTELVNTYLNIIELLKKVNSNRDEIKYYFKKASDLDRSWTSIRYIQYLEKGDASDQREAHSECKMLFDNAPHPRIKVECSIILSKHFHDGLGVKKDIYKAIESIQYAVQNNHLWSKLIYADYCSEINSLKNKANSVYLELIKQDTFDSNLKNEVIIKIINNMEYAPLTNEEAEILDTYLSETPNITSKLLNALIENSKYFPQSIIKKLAADANIPQSESILLYMDNKSCDWNHILSEETGSNTERIYQHVCKTIVLNSKINCPIVNDSDSNVVIYNLNHMCILSQLIQIRFLIHPDKKAILLANNIYGKSELFKKIVNHKIFDECYEFNGRIAYKLTGYTNVLHTIQEYYSNILSKTNEKGIYEIYTGCDVSNSFAIYLTCNNVRYTTVELNPHQLSYKFRIDSGINLKFYTKEFHNIQKYLGVIDGSSKCSKNIYYYHSGVSEKQKSSLNYWDFDNNLEKIPFNVKNEIIKAFNIPTDSLKGVTLLLTNSSGYSSANTQMPFPYFLSVYQLMIDLFSPNAKICIKAHPNDNYSKFAEYFPNAVILDNSCPIELYSLVPGFKLDTVITGSTSGNGKIEKYINKTIVSGYPIFRYAKVLVELFIVGELLKKLKITKIHQDFTNDSDRFLPDFFRNANGIDIQIADESNFQLTYEQKLKSKGISLNNPGQYSHYVVIEVIPFGSSLIEHSKKTLWLSLDSNSNINFNTEYKFNNTQILIKSRMYYAKK